MAAFAFDNSPFYRDLYTGAGLSRADLRDPEAFSTLPIIDRTLVKEYASMIRSPEATDASARVALTGGSTGEPLMTYHDARVPLLALSWRMYRWWGIEPSDDLAHVGRWATSKWTNLRTSLSWWPTKVTLVDAAMLDPRAVEEFVVWVNENRPKLIEGYVGALNEIATYVHRSGLPFHSPVALGATAAPLTTEVRQLIETSLGAPVHDQYRCSEVPWMAAECGVRNGLHVFADMRRIDVVDENGLAAAPGATGDLVVSDLSNRVFPIVRYKLGDRGSLRAETCPCGVTLPLMDPPDGRTVDMIRLPDGTVVAGGLFSIFSAAPNAVRLFRLHQNADFSITLRVVEGDHPHAREQVAWVAQNLSERFRKQVPVSVEFVDSLPYTGGKMKYVTSDIQG